MSKHSPMMKVLLPLLLILGAAIYYGQISAQPSDGPGAPVTGVAPVEAPRDSAQARSFGIDSRFEPVVKRLVDQGLPEDYVRSRLADERTTYFPKLAAISVRNASSPGEPSSAYAWVNTDESADACRAFIAQYRPWLETAEQRYGVEPEMVAALLRTETRHGKVTGTYHVLSVFASTATATDPEVLQANLSRARETLAARNADSGEVAAQLQYVRNRSEKKAKWALGELKSLLEAERAGKLNALDLKGSWAGAFGWSQFLPSSYLRRAVDGDRDGTIDLYTPADAIHSVANYLKAAGYVRGNNRRVTAALWNYNNSTPYVKSIMGLAARLKRDTKE